MEIGAGILLWRVNDNNFEFFMCSPGGPAWVNRECWNFPKGHIEEGESPFECAVREFFEETGTYAGSLNVNDYTYEGLIKQRSNKSVHVYSKEFTNEELTNCHSNTFLWTDGNEYPEIDKYKWMTKEEIKEKGGVKAYYPLFKIIEERYDRSTVRDSKQT